MDCRWDQKIPNEPILDRNFVIAQPPIIPFERPSTTTGTRAAPIGVIDFGKRVTPQEELRIANFWYHQTMTKDKTGVLLNSQLNTPIKLEQYLAKYPDRPWMRGVFNNIAAENMVKPYHVLNSDCIHINDMVKFEMQRQITGARVLAKERQMRFASPVWDQNTSVKLRTGGPFKPKA